MDSAQAENEKIKLSELLYRRIFENTQDGVLILDFETGMIMDVNPSLVELLGYSKENFLEKHLWEVGVFKNIAASKENFKTLQSKRHVRFENLPLQTKDGKNKEVEFVANAYQVEDSTIIQCNIRDITDRKIAEDKIKESEERFRSIYETSSDAIMTIEPPSWKFTAGNPAAVKIFNTKDEKEFTTLGPWDVSPEQQPDGQLSSEKAKKMIEKAMKDGSNIFEWVHKRYKGEDFPATVLLSRIELWGGKKYLQATIRDITVLKQAEEKNNMLTAIVQDSQDAILSKDLNGTILTWNKEAENLYKYKLEEAIGKNIEILLPEDRKNEVKNILNRIAKGEIIGNFETIRVTKDDKEINVSLAISPIRDGQGKIIGASSIARDITKQVEKNEELEKMNKLMVGRELKMIELKERIKQLENNPLTKISTTKNWSEKFQEGVDLEESVIAKFKDTYISEIEKSGLSGQLKKEAIGLIQILVDDSQKHESLLKSLVEKENER